MNQLLDFKYVENFLLESLAPAQELLKTLLGNSLEFIEAKTGKCDINHLKDKNEHIVNKFNISGERKGGGYIFFPLKDAVSFREFVSTPIGDSIAETIRQGKFAGEVSDTFEEIAKAMLTCFENHFKSNFPLDLIIKNDSSETLVLNQTNSLSNGFEQTSDFCLLSSLIRMESKIYGPLEVLFPLDVMGLAEPNIFQADYGEKVPPVKASDNNHGGQSFPGPKSDASFKKKNHDDLTRLISIISHDDSQLELFQENFARENFKVMLLSPDNDLKHYLVNNNPCCVFLFVKKVNDLGFAQTIKIRTALKNECPLILAGPDWTRAKVLKALRYGATDILTTPAQKESILKKFQKHLYQIKAKTRFFKNSKTPGTINLKQ